MALGLWKVLGVFAIYCRVPGGSLQRYLGSSACSLGRLGVLRTVVNQSRGCQGRAYQYVWIAVWCLLA